MDIRTIDECFKDCVRENPNKIGMCDLDKSYTWQEMDKIVDSVVNDLYNQGVRKGTHVALWASNSSKWVFIYLAIQRIGAIAVLINVAFKWRELERILSFYDVEYIYYTKMYRDSDHQNTIEMLDRSKFPLLKSAVLIDEECIDVNMLAKHSGFVSPVQINADDTCSILFTSGTTGSSKGVMLSHKNIVNNAKDIDDRMGWNKDDRMCIEMYSK